MTFERWTDRARRSVVLAQECARTLNHAEISPGHMLAGLMAEGGDVAYLALTASGLNAGDVTDALAKRGQRAEVEQPPPNIPFSPRGKKACELALRESLELGHNFIGTEHVLLGLIREGDGTGADILVTLGLSPLDVRAKVLELLHGYEQAEQQSAPPSVAKLEAPPVAPERAHDFPAGLVDLAVMLADLDGFIERKAAELARPATEEAERSRLASEARVTDLQQEFGRQLRAMERQNGRLRERLAAAGLADD